jgi:hypothetical protein
MRAALISNRQLAAMHMGFAPQTHPSWQRSKAAPRSRQSGCLAGLQRGTHAARDQHRSMQALRRSKTSCAHAATKKPQRLEPHWGVSVNMNRLSNDVFIAAVSPRACELVHTLCPEQMTSAREALRSPTFMGKVFSRPGGFGAWGWAVSLDSTHATQSRSNDRRQRAGRSNPAGTEYLIPV